MENMNFTNSSRSCWSLLRKLGAANETTRSKSTIVQIRLLLVWLTSQILLNYTKGKLEI
jgi:hypothetical protein